MSASRELERQLKRYEPCLPRPAKTPPAGPGWIHEVKHDGFRILAERDATGVTLHTPRGYDFADRFPRGVRPAAPAAEGHRHLGAIHALVGIRLTFAVPHLAQSSEHPNTFTSFRRPHA
jgi:hypothetical protein